MPKRRHGPEEVAAKRRRLGARTSQGRSVSEAIGAIGVAGATCHRWRNEFGGLTLDRVRRLGGLGPESGRLRKAVSDPTPDKRILAKALRGN